MISSNLSLAIAPKTVISRAGLSYHTLRVHLGLFCFVALVGMLSLAPGTSHGQSTSIASYQIKATLLHKQRSVDGWLRLTWRNPSQKPVKELRFHLYMNAFRNEKSTFLKELRQLGRFGAFGYRVPLNKWGWCQIKAIRIHKGADLAAFAKFISPDDGNIHDRTMLEVRLQKPVAPGQSIQVEITFRTRLPWGMFRVGYRKDYYFIGQWYPKIAVYEPKGVRGATQGRWNSHQFHATSEFYADFGSYKVELTVPSRFIVAATGQRIATQKHPQKGTTTYTYQQDRVHDFAWTASPHYRRVVRTFDPATDVTVAQKRWWAKRLKLPVSALKLKPVKMILMMQPEHMHQVERHAASLKAALREYGLWLGAYPYKTITLIDPPYEGSIRAFSGMEYATLFTAGTRWKIAPQDRNLEWLIIHEYGHMYFQGLVASNEFEEAWLDEGINTYTNCKLLRKLYPKSVRNPHLLHLPATWLSLPVHQDQLPRLGYLLLDSKQDPVAQPSWKFQSGASYGQNVYMKAALTMQNLEGIIGEETMLQALRAYVQRWKFKHPHAQDWISHIQKYSKQDLAPFFAQFVKGTKVLDYAVGRVSSQRIWKYRGNYAPLLPKVAKISAPKPPRHRTSSTKSSTKPTKVPDLRPTTQPARQPDLQPRTQPGARVNMQVWKPKKKDLRPKLPLGRHRIQAKHKPRKAIAKKRKRRRNRYRSQVIIKRKGSAIWPVEVKMVFADKSSITKHWDGKGNWVRFTFDSPSRLAHVELDPRRKLTLDVDISNNSYVLRKSNRASLGWFFRLMSWLQHILLSLMAAL